MMTVAVATTAFYLITVYAPTFGKTVLHLSTSDALLVTLLVGVSNFFWLPIGGALSDRIGRRPLLIAMALLALATTYPALSFLWCRRRLTEHAAGRFLWLSFIYGLYNGAMIPALPRSCRLKCASPVSPWLTAWPTADVSAASPRRCRPSLIQSPATKPRPATG